MAETLLAILLVNSSAGGSSLVFRWPPLPSASPRLGRPRPSNPSGRSELDNPWRAAHSSDPPSGNGSIVSPAMSENTSRYRKPALDDDQDYEWKRPNAMRDRSASFSQSRSHSPSGRNARSNSRDHDTQHHGNDAEADTDGYYQVLGYPTRFLAGILCPKRSLCHQKFELFVDDLAFIGHPVCVDADGGWRFRPEKIKPSARGRDFRKASSQPNEDSSASPDKSASPGKTTPSQATWLQTFHLVLVLDRPDPSSSASGNISKYVDIIYEQIAFTIAAVLFQEQVLFNFVETECDLLGSLKESYVSKGEPFMNFITVALEVSSVAAAMKTLYEAIKSSSIAYVNIHGLPLELQLPPYLDSLLYNQAENEADIDSLHAPEEDIYGDAADWGEEMSFGWRLPTLAPWKSLLLLDDHSGLDPHMNLKSPHMNSGDRTLAEGLIRFLDTASVRLSLADMATILDWDLETQVFPTVRWLVHHRRAKVVDIVHAGLKTVFTLPSKFDWPLSKLAADFANDFSSASVPPLPTILSTISTSSSKLTDNHFFAVLVRSKELIPLYHEIVIWMLKRDMLITLHLRIRVVATQKIKEKVREDRERSKARRARAGGLTDGRSDAMKRNALQNGHARKDEHEGEIREEPSSGRWLSFSPKSARKHSRRLPSAESTRSQLSDLMLDDEDEDSRALDEDDEEQDDDEDDYDDSDNEDQDDADKRDDNLWPSMINDPGRATPLQRRWLSAMSDGKDMFIARRFQQINQYFDGRKTDDEILHRAEISRKQLREVLHHYEEYLETFLHPS